MLIQTTLNKAVLAVICLLSLIYVWFGLGSRPAVVQAAPPPRPTVTPRPTSTPTPLAPATKPAQTPKPGVATLLLQVQPKQEGLWSVVQWQDPAGNWQDIEGWRGTVVNGKTIWWVESKDWGASPYRWVVYQPGNGLVKAISTPFALPAQAQQVLTVPVALDQER